MRDVPKRVLFVRSGGGLPGLDIHAGMWCALSQQGIEATDCWGTSAGAIVSALDAAGWRPGHATARIRTLHDCDVRQERPFWRLRSPWIDHYLRNEPISRVLSGLVPNAWEGFQKPLRVYATMAQIGEAFNVADRAFFERPADALLASSAICGAFPAVTGGDGNDWYDGGVGRNLPAPQSAREVAGFDEVWLLVASGAPLSYRKKTGILTALVRNVRWMMQSQIQDAIDDCEEAARASNVPVHALWPDLATPSGTLHFDHDLIDRAAEWTRAWIEGEETKA